jgi:hypothetical protein
MSSKGMEPYYIAIGTTALMACFIGSVVYITSLVCRLRRERGFRRVAPELPRPAGRQHSFLSRGSESLPEMDV